MTTLEGMEEMVRMEFEGGIFEKGKIFVLDKLQSVKGKEINGRRCVVVGRDKIVDDNLIGLRFHVKLLNKQTMKPEAGSKPLRILKRNLIMPDHYSSTPSQSIIPKEELLVRLNKAMDRARKEGHDHCNEKIDFRDRKQRYNYLLNYLRDDNVVVPPPPSMCMDYMIPFNEQRYEEKLRNEMKPACLGDGYVKFERFGEGLIGNQHEKCAICAELMNNKSFDQQQQIIRLPCGHTFHVACASTWLDVHNTCPICRKEPINPWRIYVFDSNKQIQIRIDEWFLSGMCERCQAVYQENDPLVQAEDLDGNVMLTPLSKTVQAPYMG